MNRVIIRRWINEYLDGEIGLADKAELERIMAQHSEVRQEYMELRRLSLLMGSLPEVSVHPARFRAHVLDALDAQERTFFTPQRVFAGAMLVALLVVSITFGLISYQQMLGGNRLIGFSTDKQQAVVQEQVYDLALVVDAPAETYFNRLLLEVSLNLVDQRAVEPFLAQTRLLEGARCSGGGGLNRVDFVELPRSVRVKISPAQAKVLAGVASEVSGSKALVTAYGREGAELSFEEFLQNHSNGGNVYLTIHFK